MEEESQNAVKNAAASVLADMTVPRIPVINYCKRDDHIATCCPLLEGGGRVQYQGRNRYSFIESPPNDINSQPLAKRLRGDSPSRTKSTPDPKRQSKTELSSIDIELAAQPLQIRSETYLPPLRPLANHVAKILSSEECPKHFVYFKLQIEKYSSSRILADIISAIDSTIWTLEGQVIGCDKLQRVKEIQTADCSLFDCDGGYMDFVTDTRSDMYFKMYIGQAQTLAERIGQHRSNAATGDITTLHYFVPATGGEFRSMNFIRLFRLDSDKFLDQEYAALCRGLLEFLMTLAFQTLPATELQKWLPAASIKIPPRTLHLNVLSPLYQCIRGDVTYHIRHATRDMLLVSPDPQLARWPAARRKQLTDRENQKTFNLGPYPKLHQMKGILGACQRKYHFRIWLDPHGCATLVLGRIFV